MNQRTEVRRTAVVAGVELSTKVGRRIEPTIPITDRRFRYYDAANTDIRRTFARIRWERARAGILETREFVGTLLVDFVGRASRWKR